MKTNHHSSIVLGIYVPNNRNKRVFEVYIFFCLFVYIGASLIAQLVKNPPAMQETWVQSLGWEDPLEKETVTYSSFLAGRIPWTQSMGSQRVGHSWATFICRKTVKCYHHFKKHQSFLIPLSFFPPYLINLEILLIPPFHSSLPLKPHCYDII